MQPMISFAVIESEKKGKAKKLRKQLKREKVARRDAEQRVCDLEFGLRNAEQATENANRALAVEREDGAERQAMLQEVSTQRDTLQDELTRRSAHVEELTAHLEALQASQPTVYGTREYESLVRYADDVFVTRVCYPGEQALGPIMWETEDAAQSWLDSMNGLFGSKEADTDAQEATQYPSSEIAETLQEAATEEPKTACVDDLGAHVSDQPSNREKYRAGEWVENNSVSRQSFVSAIDRLYVEYNDGSAPMETVKALQVDWSNVKRFKKAK